MGKSVNKFIVKLSDLSEFKPTLMVSVSPIKEKKQTFLVKLVHPNPKMDEKNKPLLVNGKKVLDIVYQEEFKSKEKDEMKGFLEALAYGKNVLLEREDIKAIAANTKYIEQLFIPQGKRGKMKLKTKASEAADEAARKAAAALTEEDEMDDLGLDDLEDTEIELEAETEEIVEEFDDEDVKPAKKAKAPKKDKTPKAEKVVKAKNKETKDKNKKVTKKPAKTKVKEVAKSKNKKKKSKK